MGSITMLLFKWSPYVAILFHCQVVSLPIYDVCIKYNIPISCAIRLMMMEAWYHSQVVATVATGVGRWGKVMIWWRRWIQILSIYNGVEARQFVFRTIGICLPTLYIQWQMYYCRNKYMKIYLWHTFILKSSFFFYMKASCWSKL